MPARPGEFPHHPRDRSRQLIGVDADDPRKSDVRVAEISTRPPGPHAGYDADLNPIDDEFINTRGSER